MDYWRVFRVITYVVEVVEGAPVPLRGIVGARSEWFNVKGEWPEKNKSEFKIAMAPDL